MVTRLNRIMATSLVVLLLVVSIKGYRDSAAKKRLLQENARLQSALALVEGVAERRKGQADSLHAELAPLSPSVHSLFVKEFQKKGLREPVADLVADLQRHPELIPFPGLPGTPMKFYDAGRIRVLSHRWVYAPFDDGHVSGEGIFEFEVAPGGKITWRTLTAKMTQ